MMGVVALSLGAYAVAEYAAIEEYLYSIPFAGGSTAGTSRLPTDPIGTFALTLTGLIPGSAVQVESGSTVFHFSIAASDTLLINLQAYAAGSPLNALTIKVRKGSDAPYYQPYRTQTTAIVGAQSIFVSQIEDQ